jgi:hypothetical protein
MPQGEMNKIPLARENPNLMSYQVNPNINPYQVHEYNQRKIQTFVQDEVRAPLVQGYEERNVQVLKGEEIKPRSPLHVYNNDIPKQPSHTFYTQNYVKSDT